jgi:hypothetical protein
MARSNKISAEFTDGAKAEALAKMLEVKNTMPFLINLTVEEKKRLRGIGNKNLFYVQKCLEGALAFPKELKVNFNVTEFEKDVALFNNLLGVQLACLSLFEMVDDTMKASGIDAMGSASEVYASLKSSAKSNANVKAIVNEIGERFAVQKRPRAKKEE